LKRPIDFKSINDMPVDIASPFALPPFLEQIHFAARH
jgi:hypothetical protein